MIQLIPANVYKNVFGESLRKMLLNDVSEIWEYPQQTIFDDTLTASSVLLSNSKRFLFVDKTFCIKKSIEKKRLGKKWFFSNILDSKDKTKFGDCYNMSISVATQLNKVLLFPMI